MPFNQQDLRDAWANLTSTGTPPDADLAARVLPEWSVGIDEWIDRLVKTYLRDYCLRKSHFKLVVAQYGGGKSHFLLAFRARAITEGFAICYLQCKGGVSLADWSSLYGMIASSVRLPKSESLGVRAVVDAAYETLLARAAAAPDPELAVSKLIDQIEWQEGYPSSSFLQVMTRALRQKHRADDPQGFRAALRWLQNEQIPPEELRLLGVPRIPSKSMNRHGLDMFYSLVKFLKEYAGSPGFVLLLDEMDMMFNARGRALARLLDALRTIVDQADDRMNSIPVFGLLAAIPAISDQMQGNQAVRQRFQVTVPFHQGSDRAPQIDLAHLANQRTLLRDIGRKLLHLASTANERQFDEAIQTQNLETLAKVADQRSADVDSRRLFVKTWCALLEDQMHRGEKAFSEQELNDALQGHYEGVRAKANSTEGDMG